MRKIFTIIIAIVCMFGCNGNDSKIDENIEEIYNNDNMESRYLEVYYNPKLLLENVDKITIQVKEKSLTSKGLTLLFINGKYDEYTFGESYKLKQMIDNEWKDVKTIIDNYAFISVGYPLKAQEIKVKKINWEWLYGTLKAGEYQLITDVIIGEGGNYQQIDLSVNFVIE